MSEEQQAYEAESVADSIRAAMTELQPDPEPAQEGVPAEEEVVEEAAEEVVEEVEEAPKLPLKARDEKKEEPAEQESEQEAEAQEEAEEVILAPASWSKEDREVFAKLDRQAQQIITRREAESDKGVKALAQDTGPLKAVAEDYRDYFRQIGTTPDQSFRVLVAAEQSLRFGTPSQKQEALAKIARDYGIAMPSTEAKAEEAYTDPEVSALRSEFDGQLNEIKGMLTDSQQRQVKLREEAASQTAAAFFEELEKADPAEWPEARYIEQVMPSFQRLVSEDRGTNGTLDVARLRQMYSNAAWSVPEVRARMQEDMSARQKASEQKVVKRTVVKRSSSASSGTGAGAHSVEPDINESVADTVKRSIAELSQSKGALR